MMPAFKQDIKRHFSEMKRRPLQAQSDTAVDDDGNGPQQQLLLVQTGDSLLAAIDLGSVQRVIPLTAVQPLPQGPDYLLGLLDLHGTGVPVMDLGLRLGLDEVPSYDLDTPIVICRSAGLFGGLVVKEVLGTTPLQPEEAQLEQTFANGSPLFQAATSTDHGLALVVDLQRLLKLDLKTDPCGQAAGEETAHKEESAPAAQL